MKNKLLLLTFFVFLRGFAINVNGQIKMIFRYDDYTLIPSLFNDSLINIFKKNNIPLCIGIIPFDSNNIFINKLSQEQLYDLKSRIQNNEIEVTLHGFNHSNYISKFFLKRAYYSEFRGRTYTDQFGELKSGKQGLDSLLDININVFVPPYNTYDSNTLKALTDLGFEIISGSLSGVYTNDKIKYMPATYEGFSELTKIIKNYKNDAVTIIVYFHSYSFIEGSSIYSKDLSSLISIDQLDGLLQWVKNQNVRFHTFSGLAKFGNFDRALYMANSLDHNLLKKILNKLKIYNYGVYSSLESHNKHKELFFINILLHLLSFILVYIFVNWLIKKFRPGLSMVILFLIIFTLAVFVYLYYFSSDYSFGMKLIIISVIFFAALLGIFRNYQQKVLHK